MVLLYLVELAPSMHLLWALPTDLRKVPVLAPAMEHTMGISLALQKDLWTHPLPWAALLHHH
jgi:hypothetical protein